MCLNGHVHIGTTWVPFTPPLRGDEEFEISHLRRGIEAVKAAACNLQCDTLTSIF